MNNELAFKALVLLLANHPLVKDLGMTKLWKLIYFIDTAVLRATNQSLTGSEFIKFEHGPVPSQGEKIVKELRKEGLIEVVQELHHGYRINRIVAKSVPQESAFTEEEQKIIGETLLKYGHQSAGYLSELSHQEPAWHYAEDHHKLKESLMFYGFKEDPEGL